MDLQVVIRVYNKTLILRPEANNDLHTPNHSLPITTRSKIVTSDIPHKICDTSSYHRLYFETNPS